MLAYVFSHRSAGGVDVADYEAALRRFHATLASAAPAGFLSSLTFRVGDRYSDWYLVANSTALDVLNKAALSGAAGTMRRRTASATKAATERALVQRDSVSVRGGSQIFMTSDPLRRHCKVAAAPSGRHS